ncbi:MAG: FkbM family methyltransferase [Candidatus Bathyarchaeia archaeon]
MPHPINFYFLCLNIFQNCLQNKVIMLRLGLGREDGWAYLDESGYGFGRSKMTFLPQRYRVKIKSLDNLLSELPLSRVDLIKIDTEGDELKILEGAAKTLKRYKPKLLIAAYHFNDESIMIEKFLQKHDYKVFRYSVPLFLSRSAELYLYAEPKQK